MKMPKKILIFDTETTGLNPHKDNIIEFGAVLVELIDGEYKIIKNVDYLIKQDKKLPSIIVQLTNITDEMLNKEGIFEEEAFMNISNLIDNETLLVGYNLQFDMSFLNQLYRKYLGPTYVLKNNILDMFTVYRDFNDYPNKLVHAIEKYGLNTPNTHRANDDAAATLELMRVMPTKIKDLENIDLKYSYYINVIGQLQKYPIPENERLLNVEYITQGYGKKTIYNIKKAKDKTFIM